MKVSVVVPCYNEESRGNFKQRVQDIVNYLDSINYDYELIFVEDGSPDKTYEVLKGFTYNEKIKILHSDDNKGKGFALRKGFTQCSGDYTMFMDADLSVDLKYIKYFLDRITVNKCLIASRYCDNAKIIVRQTPIRRLIAFLSHIVKTFMFHLKVKDTQCGFKMFPTEDLKEILQYLKCKAWLLDIEMLVYLKNKGLEIEEIPVEWGTEMDSVINNIPKVLFNCAKEVFIILFNSRRVH